jgi:hypothetical protein
MTWSGTVDHEALIEIRGRRVSARAVRGAAVNSNQGNFSSALPRRSVNVRLEQLSGRGRVELVEQPGANNNYAALVRITDSDGGSDQYSFRLAWDGDAYGYQSGGSFNPQTGGVLTPGGSYGSSTSGSYGSGGGLQWSGRVDGRIRVHAQNGRVWTTRVSGGPVYGEQAQFAGALPRANTSDIEVRKLAGRGDVRVIQQPSSGNNYTLVFEINDDDGGADEYQVEVVWR